MLQVLRVQPTIYGLDIVNLAMDDLVQTYGWNELKALPPIEIVIHLAAKVNEERLQKLTENYIVSNLKLKKALNIDKMPERAEDGFIKTIKSFE